MPSPTETLFLVQLSPVPTQTILWLEGSMVTAPIDCTSWLSKTGLKVVEPLMDFHTPPLAEPAKTVTLPPSSTASIAATRPLMAAEPMLRADSPEMVPESYFTGCVSSTPARAKPKTACAGDPVSCAVAVERNADNNAKAQTVSHSSFGRRERAIIIVRNPLYLSLDILQTAYFDPVFEDSSAAGVLKS